MVRRIHPWHIRGVEAHDQTYPTGGYDEFELAVTVGVPGRGRADHPGPITFDKPCTSSPVTGLNAWTLPRAHHDEFLPAVTVHVGHRLRGAEYASWVAISDYATSAKTVLPSNWDRFTSLVRDRDDLSRG